MEADYLALRNRYEKAWPTHQTAFILCAHRRYHPGLACAREMIAQTCARTGYPVTNIHAWHADGQWRLPAEMISVGLVQNHRSTDRGRLGRRRNSRHEYHQHQLRKDGATPYICHPVRVALTVRQEFGEDDATLLAAALLHDVIEDTPCD